MLKPETKNIQNRLATYCRTGEEDRIPGTIDSRLPHYRRLVYNIINNTMKQAFPITYKVLEKDEWNMLVDQFFRNHDCQTPRIWELPLEFYKYISAENYSSKLKRPYLDDLLYFEWMEIEVHTMPDITHSEFATQGDLFNDIILLNEESKLIRLSYPVHNKSISEAENQKGNYFILVYRIKETGQVKFIDTSVLYAYLLQRLQEGKRSVKDLIKEIAEKFSIQDINMLQSNIKSFLMEMENQGVVLGYRNIDFVAHMN